MHADIVRLRAKELSASLGEMEDDGFVGGFLVAVHQEPRFATRFVASDWPPKLLDQAVSEAWHDVVSVAGTIVVAGEAVRRHARRNALWAACMDAVTAAGLHVPSVAHVTLPEGTRVLIALNARTQACVALPRRLRSRFVSIAMEAVDTFRRGIGADRLNDADVALLQAIVAGQIPAAPGALAVEFRSVMLKLHARTMEHAIAIAMRRGLLR